MVIARQRACTVVVGLCEEFMVVNTVIIINDILAVIKSRRFFKASSLTFHNDINELVRDCDNLHDFFSRNFPDDELFSEYAL